MVRRGSTVRVRQRACLPASCWARSESSAERSGVLGGYRGVPQSYRPDLSRDRVEGRRFGLQAAQFGFSQAHLITSLVNGLRPDLRGEKVPSCGVQELREPARLGPAVRGTAHDRTTRRITTTSLGSTTGSYGQRTPSSWLRADRQKSKSPSALRPWEPGDEAPSIIRL
jgi:hypothetical protein